MGLEQEHSPMMMMMMMTTMLMPMAHICNETHVHIMFQKEINVLTEVLDSIILVSEGELQGHYNLK